MFYFSLINHRGNLIIPKHDSSCIQTIYMQHVNNGTRQFIVYLIGEKKVAKTFSRVKF